MKWIDFDKMEEHQDEEDEVFIEDWDDRFFEELADRNRMDQDENEDVDSYCAVPKDAFVKKEKPVAVDGEQYVKVPEKEETDKMIPGSVLEQSVAVSPIDMGKRYNTPEEHAELARELEFEEIANEKDDLPVTEKRFRFGRMLGLRMPETEEAKTPEEAMVQEEAKAPEETMVQEEAKASEEQFVEDSRSVDFEKQEESIASEVLDIEKIFTDYAVIRKKIKTEYEDKRTESEFDAESEVEAEAEPKADAELEVETEAESEANAESEVEAEAEPKANAEPEVEAESAPETIEELMKKREAQIEQLLQNHESKNDEEETFYDEKDVPDTSFVDDEIFAKIEDAEEENMEPLTYEFDIEPDDYEDEEEVSQDKEAVEVDLQENVSGGVTSEKRHRAELTEPGMEADINERKTLEALSGTFSDTLKVSDGVLQKRTLPNRQNKSAEKVRRAEEKTTVPEKRQTEKRGKKIHKIQSDFADEFLPEGEKSLKRDNADRQVAVAKESAKKTDKEEKRQKVKNAQDEQVEQDKPTRDFIRLIITMLIVVAVTFILVEYVGQRTEVNGRSMEDTLHDGDNLIVDKITYLFGDPERFDIVIFPYVEQGTSEEVYYIKRVIGLPGEKVQIVNGMIYINGELLGERYGKGNSPILNAGLAEKEILLGEDEYFVLGDNRNDSTDSREIGPVTRDEIVGRAWLRIWPFGDFGFLKHQ